MKRHKLYLDNSDFYMVTFFYAYRQENQIIIYLKNLDSMKTDKYSTERRKNT